MCSTDPAHQGFGSKLNVQLVRRCSWILKRSRGCVGGRKYWLSSPNVDIITVMHSLPFFVFLAQWTWEQVRLQNLRNLIRRQIKIWASLEFSWASWHTHTHTHTHPHIVYRLFERALSTSGGLWAFRAGFVAFWGDQFVDWPIGVWTKRVEIQRAINPFWVHCVMQDRYFI